MKGFCAALLATLILVGITGQAVADIAPVQIFYDLQNPGGGATWQYNYTVKNNSLGKYSYTDWYGNEYTEEGVLMFEIYFPARQDNPQWPDLKTSDAGLFSNAVKTGVPANWDVLVANLGPTTHPPIAAPVWTLNAYAIDASNPPLILIHPIPENGSVTGFSVAFNYSGSGTPGDQQFSVLRSATLDPIYDGRTQPNPVPIPPSLFLLGAGLLGLAAWRKIAS